MQDTRMARDCEDRGKVNSCRTHHIDFTGGREAPEVLSTTSSVKFRRQTVTPRGRGRVVQGEIQHHYQFILY